MSDTRIAVVTGANRGLGLATARALAERGLHTVLLARDLRAGADALAPLQAARLPIELRRVDVTHGDEVQSLAAWLRAGHGRVDVLVNNAGVYDEADDVDPLTVTATTLLATLNVNALGAVRMIQALAPLMPAGARIVNVASGMAVLHDMGGGHLGYRMSKTALNAVTRVFATELAGRGIVVNSADPGWVRTDMGGPNAPRSVAQGIAGIVWLATAPEATASGGFWRDGQRIDW